MPECEEKVVVIGGAGYIGRELTRQLLAAGCHVLVVSRSAGRRASKDARLRYAEGSVADTARIRELAAGATAVYDLSLGGGLEWADYEREVIGAALGVARVCSEQGVRRLIYTSSIAALYLGRKGIIRDEDAEDGDHTGRGFYARAKALAERAVLQSAKERGLEAVVLRPGVVVGGGGPLVHYALGDVVQDTSILGWGPGCYPLPFVLVQDVAGAMVLAKDAPEAPGKCFNLVGDVRLSAHDYVRLLAERSHRDFRFYPRAVWRIQAAELLRWILKRITGRRDARLESMRDLRSLSLATQFDCSSGKKLLGWQPVADRELFLKEAIDSLLPVIAKDDIRLERESSNLAEGHNRY